MKVYTIDEINDYGVNYQALKDSFTLKFLDRIFVRSGDFPKRFKEKAIQACLKHQQDKLESFLVESSPFLITLWTEFKDNETSETSQDTLFQKDTFSQEDDDNTIDPSCPMRYYRGVAYSTLNPTDPLTQDDLEKMAEKNPKIKGYFEKKRNFPDHPVRTYRGIPY
jgi:hypothetical protein